MSCPKLNAEGRFLPTQNIAWEILNKILQKNYYIKHYFMCLTQNKMQKGASYVHKILLENYSLFSASYTKWNEEGSLIRTQNIISKVLHKILLENYPLFSAHYIK